MEKNTKIHIIGLHTFIMGKNKKNMQELVFATHNKHKLEEVKQILASKYIITGLSDINCNEEIPEDKETLEDNAIQKVDYIYKKFNVNCFADDTGLEIEALNNKPGVYSARYAGKHGDSEANMQKVLEELKDKENRNARFRTVIVLMMNGVQYFFEGIVNGVILTEKQGEDGFGYDPIFKPEGYNISFAQMPLELKNKISHRGKAIHKLAALLLDL